MYTSHKLLIQTRSRKKYHLRGQGFAKGMEMERRVEAYGIQQKILEKIQRYSTDPFGHPNTRQVKTSRGLPQ